MSDMQSWAEREIEIACKRERGNSDNGEWDYGCACYRSALKAFESLTEDGHSGCSIGITKQILNRLIDGKPLTPIEDTDDIWNEFSRGMYQCKRMSSLFKYIDDDGTTRYRDVKSVIKVDISSGHTYHNGLVQRIIDELYPISMPYIPEEPFKVYCTDFLTDPKNGDYDTIGIFYGIKPNGERFEINKFFKEGDNDWIEIDNVEYFSRQLLLKGVIL